MVTIDYTKPKHYKDKEWLALEELQKNSKNKVTAWRAAEGGLFEVKKKRLYLDGKQVSKWLGWGMAEGVTYYVVKRGKYFDDLSQNKEFLEGYLKDMMVPFVIPVIKMKR